MLQTNYDQRERVHRDFACSISMATLSVKWRCKMSRKQATATATSTAASSTGKAHTTVYLPDALRTRLGRYMLEKHQGKMNVRNRIIVDAIDEKLKQEGF